MKYYVIRYHPVNTKLFQVISTHTSLESAEKAMDKLLDNETHLDIIDDRLLDHIQPYSQI